MERRLKAMVIEWRKTEDKDAVVKMIQALLFNQKETRLINNSNLVNC